MFIVGIVLSQAVKSTSKSLVVNVDKIWRQILITLEKLTWEGCALSKLLELTLTNISSTLFSKDIQHIFSLVFQNWEDVAKDETSTQEMCCAKIDAVTMMLSIGRSKKINIEEESINFTLNAIEKRNSNIENDESFVNSISNLVITLSKKSSANRDRVLKLYDRIMYCKKLTLDEKVRVFIRVSQMNIFENELLLPLFVRNLIKKYSKSEELTKDEFDEVRLYIMVETLDSFLSTRDIKLPDGEEYLQPYFIEFLCDNPNSWLTLPNKLLSLIEKRIKGMSIGSCNASNSISKLCTKKMLRCLTSIRPLNENAEDELSKVLDYHVQCFQEKDNENFADNLEAICLNIQMLSDLSLSCPKDFLEKVSLTLINILSENIMNTNVARAIGTIFYQASLCQAYDGNPNKIQSMKFGKNDEVCDSAINELESKLIDNLSTFSDWNRKFYLKSLTYLSDRNAKNYEIFNAMLKAENITPNVQTYRDRIKHLGDIAWTEEDECDKDETTSLQRFRAGLRFLFGNLSVNFTPLWDSTIKIIDSYLSSDKHKEISWSVAYEMMKKANEMLAKKVEQKHEIENKQILNYRNLILKALTYSSTFLPYVEKKNQCIVNDFLFSVQPMTNNALITPNIKSLEAYMELFKKFANLRNISKFNEVKDMVIQHVLGHSLASENSLKCAIDFFLAAYKSLRPHKDVLMELVDNKKWRTRFLALTEETFSHSENENIFADLIYQLVSAKLKRTAKEKRTAQISNRKFIVRTMFQVGIKRGLEFLALFKRRELISIEQVLTGSPSLVEKKIALRRLDITFDVFMLAAKNANCRKEIFGEIIELLVLQGKVVEKDIKDAKGREGAAGKRRNKLLDNIIQVYSSLKECEWREEQQNHVVEHCLWPLLFSDTDQPIELNELEMSLKQNSNNDQKFHYLSKLPKLFQLWVDDINYHYWFFISTEKNSSSDHKKNVFQSWMCGKILNSKAVDPVFKSKVFTVVCNLIITSSDGDTMNEGEKKSMASACKNDKTLAQLMTEFEVWLSSKTCLKRSRETLPRLKALQEMMKYADGANVDVRLIIEKITLIATNGTLEIQTQSIHLLNVVFTRLTSLHHKDSSSGLPTCAFKLICNITNYDNKKLMSRTLWNHIKNDENSGHSNGVEFDDNFLHGSYQKLGTSVSKGKKQCFTEQHFLFLFHYAASEIYNQDFSQRSAAVLCLRDIIRNKKLISEQANCEDEAKEFINLVDKIMLPIISKGLQNINDRIQAEFMGVLQECIITDTANKKSYLGSIQDVDQLMPSEGDDQETNFFDNMIHIQKHRRGRAMRKLATKLDENKTSLSRNCRLYLVYPLVRTYIYNESYINQPEIVNSAIQCISSLAATYNWKDYKNLLLQFLASKNLNVQSSPPFRKQRVKILSGILNAFHFPAGEESALKLKEVIGKLLQKIARAGATGNSQDVEDQVDIALFVPILKIMLMDADNKWLKSNLSMLLINLASRLRSRKIEERTASRDVLCQMAKLLGSNYFHFIFSILEGNLQRGYQLHILLFTINAVMNSMTEDVEHQSIETFSSDRIGAFDDSLPKLMDLIGNELFGNILEEKRVAALVKKTPEASKTISFGLLEKLGCFTSKGNISKILNSLLASNTTHKYITSSTSTSSYDSLQKLRKAVKSFQTGVVKNKSFGKTDFLLISHGLLSGKLLLNSSDELVNSKSNRALLQEMALNLLCHNASQPNSTSDHESKYNEKVEDMKPFKTYITECINGKDVNVVTACLKYLSIITQSRSIVDSLLDKEIENSEEDFMCTITKKCRHYQPMKNNQPYNFLCQILRNLLTHNSNYQFDNSEQLKSICLFFQMCLETNYDDVNAIKLLGLLLFKFYTEESSSDFLKLLCVCTIKCKDDMTFNMTKPIILKIVKKHRALPIAMGFYSQHITYEIVDGKYYQSSKNKIIIFSYENSPKVLSNLKSIVKMIN